MTQSKKYNHHISIVVSNKQYQKLRGWKTQGVNVSEVLRKLIDECSYDVSDLH